MRKSEKEIGFGWCWFEKGRIMKCDFLVIFSNAVCHALLPSVLMLHIYEIAYKTDKTTNIKYRNRTLAAEFAHIQHVSIWICGYVSLCDVSSDMWFAEHL